MATKRPRKDLPLKLKVELLINETNLDRNGLAEKYGIAPNTVSTIKGRKEKIMTAWRLNGRSTKKRERHGKFAQVDQATFEWFSQMRAQKADISGHLVRAQAKDFAQRLNIVNFHASNGWLHRWQKRNGIKYLKKHGEKGAADEISAESFRQNWVELSRDYAPENIFNCDETGLYPRQLRNGTLALPGEKVEGDKLSKERVTTLLTCSETGEKLPPYVIGHFQKPRCFNGVNKLPTDYDANKSAWMTADFFTKYLLGLDRKMRLQKRKILLLLDNASSHKRCEDLRLKNVKLVFLPPNTTSILQPLDQEIILSFKSHYIRLYMKKIMRDLGANVPLSKAQKIHVLDAMHLIKAAWDAVTPAVIQQGWKSAGLTDETGSDEEGEEEEEIGENDTNFDGFTVEDQETFGLTLADIHNFATMEIATEGPLSADEIVAEIQAENPMEIVDVEEENEAEEEEDVCEGTPTQAQMNFCLKMMQKYIESKGSEEDFSLLYKFNKIVDKGSTGVKQARITDFFAK